MTEGATTTSRLFVDEIVSDGDVDGNAGEARGAASMARVLLGDEVLLLPLAIFPPAVQEGDWVELSTRAIPPPPSDAGTIRKRLAADDPGGVLKL